MKRSPKASAATAAAPPRDVVAIAETDFAFVSVLRHLGEEAVTNDRVWGALIREHFDVQVVRRLHVRAFISVVESVTATLKSSALESASALSVQERVLLADWVPDLTDQGKAITKPFNTRFKRNLRFAFRLYAKAKRLAVSLDYGGVGWEALCEAVDIRNRITHPKRITEMSISDAEMVCVDQAHDWFFHSYRTLLDAEIKRLQDKLSK